MQDRKIIYCKNQITNKTFSKSPLIEKEDDKSPENEDK